jgi:hypothetical protein
MNNISILEDLLISKFPEQYANKNEGFTAELPIIFSKGGEFQLQSIAPGSPVYSVVFYQIRCYNKQRF